MKLVDKISHKSIDGGNRKETYLGAFDWWNSTIELRGDVPPERLKICLLHEMLHGISEGMKLTEEQVDRLAWGLYDTLTRNDPFI